jgi:hypothetical protein
LCDDLSQGRKFKLLDDDIDISDTNEHVTVADLHRQSNQRLVAIPTKEFKINPPP